MKNEPGENKEKATKKKPIKYKKDQKAKAAKEMSSEAIARALRKWLIEGK